MDNLFFDLKRLKYLGKNAIVGKTVRIRRPEEVVIGDYSIIDDFTYISCALKTGTGCHIASNVTLSGGQQRIVLGNYVGIAAGCSLHASSSEYISVSMDLPSIPEPFRFGGIGEDIRMDDYVLLGSHTVVLPGVYLPEGFASAAQTVIRKKAYEPWTLYGGYDGKRISRRNTRALRDHIDGLQRLATESACPYPTDAFGSGE